MNKVITINLNGVAYQLEESGYEALRLYLDNASRRLEGNPDKAEILADIEQAIGDKFRALLGAHKTVVITREVMAVIAEMGPVEDAGAGEPAAGANAAAGQQQSQGAGGSVPAGEPRAARRLYRILDGAMFSGVCNGLAAYVGVDVTFIRLAFVILSLVWGAGVLVYLVLSFIVPAAETPAEKAAASGAAATAQEFIRRAKAGYYEGMRSFGDKQAHREWRRKFKREMREWKHGFRAEMQQGAQHWQQTCSQLPRHWVGPIFASPLLGLLHFCVVLLGLGAIFSLVMTGAVLGVALPAGIPLWVGIVFVVVIWHVVSWPIKAMRYSCYFGPHGPAWGRPAGGFFDSLVWLAFAVLVLWLLDHYVPEFHEVMKQVPGILHRAIDAVQQWLATK